MFAIYLKLLAVTISLCCSLQSLAQETINVGEFSQQNVQHWQQKSFSGETRYQLKQDNGRWQLQATSDASASAFYRSIKIDLLQNGISVEELHKLLIAKDFTQIDSQIYLECETTQFSYVVSKLKPFFNSFNPTAIERSGKFITKTGADLKANNLHKNKVHNPKEKEEIDKIIQQLQ